MHPVQIELVCALGDSKVYEEYDSLSAGQANGVVGWGTALAHTGFALCAPGSFRIGL